MKPFDFITLISKNRTTGISDLEIGSVLIILDILHEENAYTCGPHVLARRVGEPFPFRLDIQDVRICDPFDQLRYGIKYGHVL